ncbi:ATP-binding cassette sub-family B member 7, mitochondrial isoform X5 [Rhizophagus irregularis DAOM 181602=DAOM 197198]|nr:ATP-binding cassette sub-family B member 7, mitochondrial isoform X5 [Rhizophagus irregularis DAOM 181602=DAOM 197198]CAB4481591.1 unnamed protein product [Rhizophagus irregularis]
MLIRGLTTTLHQNLSARVTVYLTVPTSTPLQFKVYSSFLQKRTLHYIVNRKANLISCSTVFLKNCRKRGQIQTVISNPIWNIRYFAVNTKAPLKKSLKEPTLPASRPPAAIDKTIRTTQTSTDWKIIKNLVRYIWPKDDPAVKIRVVTALSLLVAGKLLNVQVPFFFKHVVDSLNIDMSQFGTVWTIAGAMIIGYGAARIGSTIFQELRNAIFANVAQKAIRKLARNVFYHLHQLDLNFHLSRQTGGLSRAIDRGTKGISFLLSSLVFHVIPTALEISIVCSILVYNYGTHFATVTALTMLTYAVFTIKTTSWRTKFRKEANQADNEAATVAVDSLINYEAGLFQGILRELRQSLIDMDIMFNLQGVNISIKDSLNAKPLMHKGGEIKFEDVIFGYHPDRLILKGISFTVPRGKKVAVVGPSGCGKSTILRLLFRFYDPQSGNIYIDGQNIKDVTLESLRANIGVVPQDTSLFNNTIYHNIAYGQITADRDKVESAAKRARIHNVIMSLPDKYKTLVGERGLMLSGGEKQRIALARTILKDPPIIFFDEATSALDTHTEQSLLSNIRSILQESQKTSMFVAHHLSSIADADKIIVLRDGAIVEQGTHDVLMQKEDGIYREMWFTQEMSDPAFEEEEEISEFYKEI